MAEISEDLIHRLKNILEENEKLDVALEGLMIENKKLIRQHWHLTLMNVAILFIWVSISLYVLVK